MANLSSLKPNTLASLNISASVTDPVTGLTSTVQPLTVNSNGVAITGNLKFADNTIQTTAYPGGITGYTGSQGYTGSKGDTGSTGNTGSTGSQGVIGYTGSKGDTGSAGGTGSQGGTGYTGSAGDPNAPETVYSVGNVSGSWTPNKNNGTIQKATLTGNTTLNAITNLSAGQGITLILTQDATGSRTLTADAAYKFAAGYKTLSTTAGAIDMLSIFYDGTYYYTSLGSGYA